VASAAGPSAAHARPVRTVTHTQRLPPSVSTNSEGVVAKRRRGKYVPGDRVWVKTKNRAYWRYEMERESALTKLRVKQFV
jgi:ATP-dependent DNA ligase